MKKTKEPVELKHKRRPVIQTELGVEKAIPKFVWAMKYLGCATAEDFGQEFRHKNRFLPASFVYKVLERMEALKLVEKRSQGTGYGDKAESMWVLLIHGKPIYPPFKQHQSLGLMDRHRLYYG